jgi:DNA invertase Pin-like site-specific DNA recombinase
MEDCDVDGTEKCESNSISNQRSYLDDFISKNFDVKNCEIMEVIDDGKTATNFEREGIQKVLKLAEMGKIKCLLVKDFSRFSRVHIETGDYLEQKFPMWGLRFISVNDGYDSENYSGITGGIDVAFKNLIYELYSRDISEKVRSGTMSAIKSGKYAISFAPYGYRKNPKDKHKLIIDEAQSGVVKRIFNLTENGYKPAEICRIFNAEHIPTSNRKMAKNNLENKKNPIWLGSMISKILQNEAYTGKLIFGKTKRKIIGDKKSEHLPKDEWTFLPNILPVIITQEQFDRVQLLFKRRENHIIKKKSTSLFSDKIKCGICGKSLDRNQRNDGFVYKCRTPSLTENSECFRGKILESDVYNVVLSVLQKQFALADKVIKSSPKIDTENFQKEISELQKFIEKSKSAKMSLWEQFHERKITKEKFQSETDKIENQVLEYENKISKLKEQIENSEIENDKKQFLKLKFSDKTVLQQLTRTIVDEFISQIRVYSENRIEVILNYSDIF